MDRKDFLKTSCGLCSVTVIMALLESCKKEDEDDFAGKDVNFTLDLNDSVNSALNNTGGSVHRNGVLVIRKSSTEFVALSEKCTHQGCTVGYSTSNTRVECPCHGSVFNTNGGVINGPASSPLRKYSVTQNGTVLTIN